MSIDAKNELWSEAVSRLGDSSSSPDEIIESINTITELADSNKSGELYKLIQHPSIVVREGVAEALIKVEGAKALSSLFAALKCGEEEGFDNDTLATLTIDCVEAHKDDARSFLRQLALSKSAIDKRNAAWALEYLE